jgi:hypothetical protein
MIKFLYTRNLNLKIYESLTSRSNKKNLKTVVKPIKETIVKKNEPTISDAIYDPTVKRNI